jgi:hypothetical protein
MRVSSQNYFDNIINNLCTALSKENEVVLVGTLSKEEKEPDTEPGTFNTERAEVGALNCIGIRSVKEALTEYMERGTLSEAKAVRREYKIRMYRLSMPTIPEYKCQWILPER